MSYECDCCGALAAPEGSLVSDGQPLACGCSGQWIADGETAYISMSDDPCRNPRCIWDTLPEPEAIALLKSAPKTAGAWEQVQSTMASRIQLACVRRRINTAHLNLAGVSRYERNGVAKWLGWCTADGANVEYETREAAMAGVDARLREDGWLLEGGAHGE